MARSDQSGNDANMNSRLGPYNGLSSFGTSPERVALRATGSQEVEEAGSQHAAA